MIRNRLDIDWLGPDGPPIWRRVRVAAGLSIGFNVLALVQPLFMLHVYDYVLTSGSLATLGFLLVMALFLVAVQGAVDHGRAASLAEAGRELDQRLRERLLNAALALRAHSQEGDRARFVGDLETVKTFVSSAPAMALMDLPWTPIFLVALWFLSPWLVLLVIAWGALVFVVSFFGEARVRRMTIQAIGGQQQVNRTADELVGSSDVLLSMGMVRRAVGKWSDKARRTADESYGAADANASTSAAVRSLRLMLQIMMLALAAWLVLGNKLSGGAIFACSMLGAKALGPIDVMTSGWRSLVTAKTAWEGLARLAKAEALEVDRVEPGPVKGALHVENVSLAVGKDRRLLLRNVSLQAKPGAFIGVIGPSGSGKSTLARLLAGSIAPSAGTVRLDGLELIKQPREIAGPWVGYLPQDVQLVAGTIADNIRRFHDGEEANLIAASTLAGAHERIVRLPEGYETEVGRAGAQLSGGERAMIGLARALFGGPSLVVLDEPFAHLDAEGSTAAWDAIRGLRRDQKTLVMVTHRPADLRGFDLIAVMNEGRLVEFGPAGPILARIAPPPAARTAK